MESRFEERYQSGDLPWDHGMVDFNLVETVAGAGIKPCRVLDIGCGTGDNAIWLAEQGFDVVGCDLSTTAVRFANAKAEIAGARCHFIVADFLAGHMPSVPFGFAFDRGCLHSIPDALGRKAFAERVGGLLEQGGLWLSLVGNADEPKRDVGPPQLSAVELASFVEPYFEILSLKSGLFGSDQQTPPRAWICLMRKR
ncbi:hypothetical protein PDESU_02942 [Pontiella desulfatans]|uniref:Uncharacterized protein n=1 Tax=Pontiella desulfatans TaxID=2750659 RepID=A0A6C2U4B0_PONDE|nr:class I SAM-dependent methyltransferase [Pontiella desulfatans]VGO14381.1 hypothetical protein PDESU_02942 [Pontiella desulfatans]